MSSEQSSQFRNSTATQERFLSRFLRSEREILALVLWELRAELDMHLRHLEGWAGKLSLEQLSLIANDYCRRDGIKNPATNFGRIVAATSKI